MPLLVLLRARRGLVPVPSLLKNEEIAVQSKSLRVDLSPEIELRKILPLEQAAEITNLSPDTLKRRHAALILKLSPRRLGMRLSDVLSIGERPVA
jgi:hypothetical protein